MKKLILGCALPLLLSFFAINAFGFSCEKSVIDKTYVMDTFVNKIKPKCGDPKDIVCEVKNQIAVIKVIYPKSCGFLIKKKGTSTAVQFKCLIFAGGVCHRCPWTGREFQCYY